MLPKNPGTKEKILSTSYLLFSQQGYDTTGVAQICEKANISKGAFYHYFPSKHELFITLLDSWLQGIDASFCRIQQETPSTVDQLKLMASNLNLIFSESDQISMFLEVWLQSMRDPSISEKIIAPYYKYLAFFENIFKHGIAEGSISEESNAQLSSRLIMAFAMGLILQCMIEPHGEDWPKMSNFGLEKILTGLQKEIK
jgi:AcrR family transcriptional regulator